jgi:hypothetical protein
MKSGTNWYLSLFLTQERKLSFFLRKKENSAYKREEWCVRSGLIKHELWFLFFRVAECRWNQIPPFRMESHSRIPNRNRNWLLNRMGKIDTAREIHEIIMRECYKGLENYFNLRTCIFVMKGKMHV